MSAPVELELNALEGKALQETVVQAVPSPEPQSPVPNPAQSRPNNGASVKPTAVIPMGMGMMKKQQSSPNLNFRTQFERKAKMYITKLLDNNIVVSFMMLLTMWALFSNDIKAAAAPKQADDGFAVVITIAFFLFVLEIILTCYVNPNYIKLPDWDPLPHETQMDTWIRRMTFGDFYFWLDWLATLTLLFEIPWALGNILSNGSGVQSAKAIRLVRLVRMVRLVRLVKLYKYAQQSKEMQKKQARLDERRKAGEVINEEDDVLIVEESHVGAAMADITNKRVLILILVMLIVVPVLTVSETDGSGAAVTSVIHALATQNGSAVSPTVF